MNELEDHLNNYISGAISFLTYRERRSDYIKSFVNSGYLPDDTIPLKDTDQAQIKAAIRKKIQENISAENTPPISTAQLNIESYTTQTTMSSQSKTQYIGLGVLIIIAVLAWYYSSQLPENHTASTTSKDFIQNTPTKAPETKARFDQTFVINFLKMDQWNSDTLSEFLVKWQKLSRTEKKQTKQGQSFIRLKNSLRLRILEQQALQSTKNKTAERQENLLIWFASQIAVSIN